MQLQDALSQEKARHRDSVDMMEKKNSRIKELEPRVKSAAEAINSLKVHTCPPPQFQLNVMIVVL